MAVDSVLETQIAAAQAAHKPVDVVVYLRAPVGIKGLSPQGAKELADRVLDRTEKSVGEAPQHATIFENLNALAVGASADFILCLANQPEVLSVKTSQPPESFAFEPRKTPGHERPRKRGRKTR